MPIPPCISGERDNVYHKDIQDDMYVLARHGSFFPRINEDGLGNSYTYGWLTRVN